MVTIRRVTVGINEINMISHVDSQKGGALILDPKSSRLSRCVRIVIAKHSPFAILETGL